MNFDTQKYFKILFKPKCKIFVLKTNKNALFRLRISEISTFYQTKPSVSGTLAVYFGILFWRLLKVFWFCILRLIRKVFSFCILYFAMQVFCPSLLISDYDNLNLICFNLCILIFSFFSCHFLCILFSNYYVKRSENIKKISFPYNSLSSKEIAKN